MVLGNPRAASYVPASPSWQYDSLICCRCPKMEGCPITNCLLTVFAIETLAYGAAETLGGGFEVQQAKTAASEIHRYLLTQFS